MSASVFSPPAVATPDPHARAIRAAEEAADAARRHEATARRRAEERLAAEAEEARLEKAEKERQKHEAELLRDRPVRAAEEARAAAEAELERVRAEREKWAADLAAAEAAAGPEAVARRKVARLVELEAGVNAALLFLARAAVEFRSLDGDLRATDRDLQSSGVYLSWPQLPVRLEAPPGELPQFGTTFTVVSW